MIYLKRLIVVIAAILYYGIIGPLCVFTAIIGFFPSFVIGYIVTGDANVGPTRLFDFLEGTVEILNKLE